MNSRSFLTTLCVTLLALFVFSGCAGLDRRGDRCWLRPDRYESAQRLYDRSGSIELTAKTLREADWLPCEVNQAIYRLKKENSL